MSTETYKDWRCRKCGLEVHNPIGATAVAHLCRGGDPLSPETKVNLVPIKEEK